MYEVEIRVRLNSPEFKNIKAKLRGINAKDLGKKRVKDTIYGLKGLYSVKETGFCYRIREYGKELIVDRKGQLPSAWNEEKIEFQNKKQAHNYFLDKGLKPYLIIDRIRHEFEKGNIRIAFDEVHHLGKFVEFETMVSDTGLADLAKEQLMAFIGKLGISEDKIEPMPYVWLFTLELEKNMELAKKMAKKLGVTVNQLFNK